MGCRKDILNLALPLAEISRRRVRDAVQAADVVLGYDLATGSIVPFFGREKLSAPAGSEHMALPRLVVFQYDCRTLELEFLVAAVERLKGACCYQGSGTFAFVDDALREGSDGQDVEAEVREAQSPRA